LRLGGGIIIQPTPGIHGGHAVELVVTVSINSGIAQPGYIHRHAADIAVVQGFGIGAKGGGDIGKAIVAGYLRIVIAVVLQAEALVE